MILEIPAAKTMPRVLFKDGVLTIEGRSIPQESSPFFAPLLKALNEYSFAPMDETVVELRLEYLNSDSMRSLMNILTIMEKIYAGGRNVIVNWYYTNEDDIIYDAGGIFQSLLELPIQMKKK